MRPTLLALLALLALPPPAAAAPARLPRVELDTDAGRIVVELETRRAPVTANNFLAYVDGHNFDGTTFYRVAPGATDPTRGFIQGGVNHDARRMRWPIEHEPTYRTGLSHTDGVLSMARNAPGTAAGDFTIVVKDARFLDGRAPTATSPAWPGYAAFGRVVSGMDVVRRIMTGQTYPGGYSRETMGQILRRPVRIVRAFRVK